MRVHIVSMRSSRVCSVPGVLFGAVLLFAPSGEAFAAPVLERVIILERHGVRTPTDDNETLRKDYSDKDWPKWPDPGQGVLTDHGATAMERIGEGLRLHYSGAGLLPRTGCASAIFIWADAKVPRTVESARAVGRGLNPSPCSTVVKYHLPLNKPDPLFDPVEGGVCPFNDDAARQSVEPRLAMVLRTNKIGYARARTLLQSILTPPLRDCAHVPEPRPKWCLIAGGDNVVPPDGKLSLVGPLAFGSTVSENILLERGQGMADDDVGWGHGNPPNTATIMPLHNLASAVMRSDPYVASRHGSTLMQEILDALDGKPGTFPGSVPLPADAKLVIFLGHDTNIANLGGLLRAFWDLPGEPDRTGPGAAMAFEVWRDGNGPRTVKIKMFYQTLQELRDLTRFGASRPLGALPLAIPGCGRDGVCGLDRLKAALAPALAHDCLKPH
jgi:4-phytase/acid phosphatase